MILYFEFEYGLILSPTCMHNKVQNTVATYCHNGVPLYHDIGVSIFGLSQDVCSQHPATRISGSELPKFAFSTT